jgi:hypothetical protein
MTDDPSAPHLSRRSLIRGAMVAGAAAAGVTAPTAGPAGAAPAAGPAATPVTGVLLPDSTFFGTASVSYHADVSTASDGDLWPSAWADDGNLYTANGDGRGFSANGSSVDIVGNRVSGLPPSGLSGVRQADSAAIGPIWSDPAQYNRKPTGMIAIDGNGDGVDELYLAVQDLKSGSAAFDDAPAASISRSTDHGATWTHTSAPMFTDHVFTTIFFLDFGRSGAHRTVLGADGGYVYAYGLDGNWRASYSDTVPDPVDLFLARVPVGAIQDRARWTFFAGPDGAGGPTWTADIAGRKAVLHDDRTLYGNTIMSQGGVLYNAPLDRYLYTSWSEATFEFYEAPAPWGPWKLFLHKDFGPYPWWGTGSSTPKNGGYATTIPATFVSADGLSMWVQSNWFVNVGAGSPNYDFSLRRLTVTPYVPSTPTNAPGPDNLARTGPGTVAIDKTSHYGHLAYLNDGVADTGEDSWDGTAKTSDQWGYTWPRTYRMNRVVYTTGTVFGDGGWFASGLKVQVRQNFRWVDVTGVDVSPNYPYSNQAGSFAHYAFTFDATWGDGVRITGVPGGTSSFTSIAELEIYYDN